MRTILFAVVLILSAFSCCQAQNGAMALTGKVRDLKVENDDVLFRFTGHISFPVRGMKVPTLEIRVEDVFMKISKWDAQPDSANQNGFKQSSVIPLDKVSAYIEERSQKQKTVVIGVASPVVFFSDFCVIEKIEAKKIIVLD